MAELRLLLRLLRLVELRLRLRHLEARIGLLETAAPRGGGLLPLHRVLLEPIRWRRGLPSSRLVRTLLVRLVRSLRTAGLLLLRNLLLVRLLLERALLLARVRT